MKSLRSKLTKTILWILLATAVAGSVLFGMVALSLSKDLPSVEEIDKRQVSQSTKIYDREGQVLLYEISAGQKRTVIPLEEMPRSLTNATIAIEDEKFYEEPGFDWRAIIRALLVNLKHGKILQGGSTITQQLAKNAFLTPEQTITRKIKEFILALKLNRRLSKDEILGLYLNEIPYGPTLYGVEAASHAYFGKSARHLSIAESALLAALPKAPSYYSPWGTHVKELLARGQFILKKMFKLDKITQEELDAALAEKLVFETQSEGLVAPHFVLAVQDYLVKKYGEDIVRTGGLTVKTTLDARLQEIAEKVVKEGAEQNTELYEGHNAALVAEDATTGQILALVGSKDYFATSSLPEDCIEGVTCKFEPNFNAAMQALRQPGSALKPFAYLTAFTKGYAPETAIFDVPTEFFPHDPPCPQIPNFLEEELSEEDDCFHPQNFDETFRGPVTFRRALAQSINIPAVKVLYLAGIEDTLETLKNFGVTTLDDPRRYGLSLVLGGGEVKLIELVGAYAVLAQEGVRYPQSLVLEVRGSDGTVLESHQDQGERVVEPQYPQLVNDILLDTEERAGLFGGSLPLTLFPEHDVALKTGTSNDYRDAWALGYTPSLVAGVWAGNNDNTPMHKRGSSILAAVPIWSKFMREALKERSPEAFARPEKMPSQKPILAGDYLFGGQIHSILYYVSRREPTGPPPQSPYDDSQFPNWEASVIAWATKNIPNFQNLNQLAWTGGGLYSSILPQVKIVEPRTGTFVRGAISVQAELSANTPLKEIVLYFNNQVVHRLSGALPQRYDYRFTFIPSSLVLQNNLEVEVTGLDGIKNKSSVVLYQ